MVGKVYIYLVLLIVFMDADLLIDDDEFVLDEVKGTRSKRKMAVLNKEKLSRAEMDDLLNSQD